jgi:hypothetical protein
MWHAWDTREVHIGFGEEKPERRRTLGRPRRGWEESIKMDFSRSGLARQGLV